MSDHKKAQRKRRKQRKRAQERERRTSLRHDVFARDRCCLRCGTIENLTLDHVVPQSQGGRTTIHNLQTLCKACNQIKGAQTIDYRQRKGSAVTPFSDTPEAFEALQQYLRRVHDFK